MSGRLPDSRYSIRGLLKAPGFTFVAVLVLALGIGANTAIFTLVNAMVVRPLPGRADELVGLYSHDRTKPDSYRGFSYPNFADIRDQSAVFDGLTAHMVSLVGMPAGDTTRRAFVELVSSDYFDTLGVKPAAGRTFSAEEERPGAGIRVVIVGYDRWKQAGFDPAFIGRTITINARDFTVIGVAPPEFTGTVALIAPEVWLPLGVFDTVVNDIFKNKGTGLADRGNDSLIVAGRLKPGVSESAATARLEAVSRHLEEAFPAENRNQVLSLHRLPRISMSTEPRADEGTAVVTTLLMAMSGVVLLIACLNLANMLLARGTARRREIAIRLALGGARARIVRQLLTESLLLAVAGGAAGLVIAYWAVRILMASLATVLPLTLQVSPKPDLYVLAATCGFAVASTLLFGLVPALKLSRVDLVTDLKADAGGRGGLALGRRFGPRNVLVISQIALSLALLIVGGLFGRGALKAATADPGFRYERELLVSLDPSLASYDEPRGRRAHRAVLDRLRALPGIEAAGMASSVPFGELHEGRRVERLGRSSPQDEGASATYMIVGAQYFSALGLRMLRGREFTRDEEESTSAPRVAIIAEPLARHLFPNEDPLGQQIRFAQEGDARGRSADEFQPME
ncbi:MAG: ABC transporter permease, partial [Acidobacteria bacterium]|nr:ABC transporter permease [Acidobacteriota bacterium]